MSTKIEVSEDLAKAYARAKGVSLEEAYQKLEDNFKKEADQIDLRQQYHVLIKAFREMSPKLAGVVVRENDNVLLMRQLKGEISSLRSYVSSLEERLDFERKAYAKSLKILNGIVEEDKKTIARIKALEDAQLPLYKRIWNKIKCLLKN